jgi:glycosyltransferase involved in cell wall biosynthesis
MAVDGENALMVAEHELQGAILTLVNNSDLRNRLAERGATVAKTFGWDEVCKQFLKICKDYSL